MKIYIVTKGDYSDRVVVSVHSSIELAMKYYPRETWKTSGCYCGYCNDAPIYHTTNYRYLFAICGYEVDPVLEKEEEYES